MSFLHTIAVFADSYVVPLFKPIYEGLEVAEAQLQPIDAAVTRWTNAHLPQDIARISQLVCRSVPFAVSFALAPPPIAAINLTLYSIVKAVSSLDRSRTQHVTRLQATAYTYDKVVSAALAMVIKFSFLMIQERSAANIAAALFFGKIVTIYSKKANELRANPHFANT